MAGWETVRLSRFCELGSTQRSDIEATTSRQILFSSRSSPLGARGRTRPGTGGAVGTVVHCGDERERGQLTNA
jgi:hypothetical protein